MRRSKAGHIEPNYLSLADMMAALFAIFIIAYFMNNYRGLIQKAEFEAGRIKDTYELRENLLFESGSAKIKKEGISTLVSLGEDSLKMNPRYKNGDVIVLVQGFTDDRKINTRDFPSNWELSSKRAVNVVKILIDEGVLDSNRVAAAGFGQYYPEYSNENEEGRALNRRIRFTLVEKEVLKIK
jgi:chemotaxis protein MotB